MNHERASVCLEDTVFSNELPHLLTTATFQNAVQPVCLPPAPLGHPVSLWQGGLLYLGVPEEGLEGTQASLSSLQGHSLEVCLNLGVQISKLPGKGRGLVATRKLAMGDLVLEVMGVICLDFSEHGQHQEFPLLAIDSEDSEVAIDVFRSPAS